MGSRFAGVRLLVKCPAVHALDQDGYVALFLEEHLCRERCAQHRIAGRCLHMQTQAQGERERLIHLHAFDPKLVEHTLLLQGGECRLFYRREQGIGCA